jgi:hypothetical protein
VLAGGVIWGIGHSAGWGGKKVLPAPQQGRRPYAYLNANEVPDAKTVEKVLSAYTEDDVLGTYARASLADLDEATQHRTAIMQILDAEFEPHSMTWERYCAPLDTAFDTIVANAAQMANHLQAFDSQAYARLDRMERGGVLEGKRNELERLEIMNKALSQMDALKDANYRVLVELERLQSELSQMSGHDLAGKTDEIAEEIERLAKEAKYYA